MQIGLFRPICSPKNDTAQLHSNATYDPPSLVLFFQALKVPFFPVERDRFLSYKMSSMSFLYNTNAVLVLKPVTTTKLSSRNLPLKPSIKTSVVLRPQPSCLKLHCTRQVRVKLSSSSAAADPIVDREPPADDSDYDIAPAKEVSMYKLYVGLFSCLILLVGYLSLVIRDIYHWYNLRLVPQKVE